MPLQKIEITEQAVKHTGKTLKSIRLEKKMLQKDLARSMNMNNQETIAYIENKATGPSLLHLVKYLNAIGWKLTMEKKK